MKYWLSNPKPILKWDELKSYLSNQWGSKLPRRALDEGIAEAERPTQLLELFLDGKIPLLQDELLDQ